MICRTADGIHMSSVAITEVKIIAIPRNWLILKSLYFVKSTNSKNKIQYSRSRRGQCSLLEMSVQ
jgi:hypothetical protein